MEGKRQREGSRLFLQARACAPAPCEHRGEPVWFVGVPPRGR